MFWKPRATRRGRRNVANLRRCADRINRDHFDGRLRFSIGWIPPDRLAEQARRNEFVYGQCRMGDPAEIHINPAIGDLRVPQHVMMYTIYHELIHAAGYGDHDETFREIEARWPGATDCAQWEQQRIESLKKAFYGYARCGGRG